MTLQELLTKFVVRVMSRQNDQGLVRIGVFKTYAEAGQFVTEVKTVPGCRVPDYTGKHDYTIDPARETKPEWQYLNARADREEKFTITANIGAENPLFRTLPKVSARTQRHNN